VLVIAVAKGRFLKPSLDLLHRAGIRFEEDVEESRKLIFDSPDGECRVIVVKPVDAPTYVEYGAADVGIAGRDVLLESKADVLRPLDLGFGRCKIVLAAPQDTAEDASEGGLVRVATKYPNVALAYFNGRGVPVEIIPLSGSIELAPLVRLADRIVDLVETGQTLRENGMKVIDVIADSSACLMINRASYQTKKKEIAGMIDTLESLA
jgi:ATP phosphoribosyltransferase